MDIIIFEHTPPARVKEFFLARSLPISENIASPLVFVLSTFRLLGVRAKKLSLCNETGKTCKAFLSRKSFHKLGLRVSSVFHKHNLGPPPRAFISFLVFRNPDETLALFYEILLQESYSSACRPKHRPACRSNESMFQHCKCRRRALGAVAGAL